jgi:RNA polymerase sigma-70 factor (ECF subfamily)
MLAAPRMPAEVVLEICLGGLRDPSRLVILRVTVERQPGRGARGRAVDRELVVRAQQGEESAFAELLRQDGDLFHATAHHILRDADLAADAAQQAMIDIWRNLPSLREPDAYKGWAYRIVVRAALAEAKRRSTWRIRVAPVDIEGEPGRSEDARIEDRDELERGFAQLPIDHRTVVVLKHYAGLSNAEIAVAMAIPEGTVRSRLFNALQALRAALDANRRTGEEPVR